MKRTLFFLLLACLAPAFAGPLDETRYCQVEPKRTADGSISRRADVLAAFKKAHPCPATGKTSGACPGWGMDHVGIARHTCRARIETLPLLPLALQQAVADIYRRLTT